MSDRQLLQDCITCLGFCGFDVIDNSENDPTYPWVIKKNTRGEYSAGTSFTATDLIYKVCKQLSKEEEVMNKLLGWEYNTNSLISYSWKKQGDHYYKVFTRLSTLSGIQKWLHNPKVKFTADAVVRNSFDRGIRPEQLCSFSIYDSFREGFTG